MMRLYHVLEACCHLGVLQCVLGLRDRVYSRCNRDALQKQLGISQLFMLACATAISDVQYHFRVPSV